MMQDTGREHCMEVLESDIKTLSCGHSPCRAVHRANLRDMFTVICLIIKGYCVKIILLL